MRAVEEVRLFIMWAMVIEPSKDKSNKGKGVRLTRIRQIKDIKQCFGKNYPKSVTTAIGNYGLRLNVQRGATGEVTTARGLATPIRTWTVPLGQKV